MPGDTSKKGKGRGDAREQWEDKGDVRGYQ